MSDFIFYSSGRYYFPEQIEIFTGDDIAYQKIGEGSIERYSVELKVCYGKGLRFGGSCKLEYYSLRFLGIEFFENLFSCFTLIEFPFGLLYGEYFSNNEWQCGYFYELCIAKLRNGFEISTFSVKDSLAFKFKSYLATFGRDLTFSISYIHSLNIKNAYPFELTVSKFYENFEIAFNFLPSDVVDSSFKVVLSYYF
ncbi:MAG: hypothetical protein N2258_07765 [Brevinematales bacterium]|nr:hypothetical protein [Brevinematales bacterium]